MPGLVALDLPAGPAFVAALRRAWDDGDAVLPLDTRLPPAARQRLLARLRPTAVVDLDGGERACPDGVPAAEGDALVVPTSGSTGEPKGVVLTHAAVAASARATSARLGVDPDRDQWLCCLPVAHMGGLAVVTRALLTDTPVVALPRFDVAAVTTAAGRGATLVSLVATALARVDPALFRLVVLGGAAPPATLPANVVVTYGMTETGSGVVYDGRPLDGVEVRLVDGEIQLRGPMLLRAYRGDGTGDDAIERDPRDPDGWLATDDAGSIGPDGRLVVHGRRGDVIVTGGEKVWPAPVERRLTNHPGVREAAVVGRPDPEWGQSVTAVVVPADPRTPPSLDDLRAWVKDQLPPYCAPRAVELTATLPRAGSGKVVRRLL